MKKLRYSTFVGLFFVFTSVALAQETIPPPTEPTPSAKPPKPQPASSPQQPTSSGSSAVEEAKQLFNAGQALFDAGSFEQAAEKFLAAYARKPFPAITFNAAVCFEKSKKFERAIMLFEQYLAENKKAADKTEVTERIASLRQQMSAETNPDGTTAAPQVLPDLTTKSVVYIESRPGVAEVYLNDRKSKSIGKTPWTGTLEGEHAIILVAQGFETSTERYTPRRGYNTLVVVMRPDEKLGWLEVNASNAPGASVFLDRKDRGAIGRTPFRDNVEKGKHTLYIVKDGYKEVKKTVTVKAGEVHKINVKLKADDVGFVDVSGQVNDATVLADNSKPDGCPKAPCRFRLKSGKHKVDVKKKGKKDYQTYVTIEPRTETLLKVQLMDKPSRSDALVQFVFAGVFIGGGAFMFSKAEDWGDSTDSAGADTEGSIGGESKYWKWGSYGIMGIGAISLIRGTYYLFREKGPASTGSFETKKMAWEPSIRPGYAGVNTTFRF